MMKVNFFIAILMVLNACSSSMVEFNSADPTSISLIKYENTGEGESIGQTPLKIEKEKLASKMLVAQSAGKPPQYFAFIEDMGDLTQINIRYDKIEKVKDDEITVEKMNMFNRTILNAYQNLLNGSHEIAIELAEKAKTIIKDAAAPEIVSGLAHKAMNQNNRAKAAFSKAKILDPADPSIDKLLESLR